MAKKAFLFAIAFAAFCVVSCSDGGSSGGSSKKDSPQAKIQEAYEYAVEYVAGIVEYRTVYLAGGEPDKHHGFGIEQCGLDTVCIDSLVRAVIDEKLKDYGIKAECALDTNCLLAWRDSMTASAEQWEDDGSADDEYDQSCHLVSADGKTCEEYAWSTFGGIGAAEGMAGCLELGDAAEGGRCKKTKCTLQTMEDLTHLHVTYALDKSLCPDDRYDSAIHMEFAEGVLCYEFLYSSKNSSAANQANMMLSNGYATGTCPGMYSVVCAGTVSDVPSFGKTQNRVTPNHQDVCAP